MCERSQSAAAGFTLVELLVAVTLLVLIMLATTYIFSTSTEVISETQGVSECNIRLGAFEQVFRRDIKNIEHQGFLIMGARRQEAYGSRRQAEIELKQTFRDDWLMFLTGSEVAGSVENRAYGQTAKVYYGHSATSDPLAWQAVDQTSWFPYTQGACATRLSQFATEWTLLREELILIHQFRAGSTGGQGLEYGGISQYGTGALYLRDIFNYVYRNFRWTLWPNEGYMGSVTVNHGPAGSATGRLAIYEPIYYHTFSSYGTGDQSGFRALAHCSRFQMQYAMPADLRAGPNGGVLWRDPAMHDPANVAAVPTGGFNVAVVADPNAGRTVFAPGDVWPALVKCTVEVWDPLERTDGGRSATFVVPVP
ncbi:MAG: prepilin-type N-terminal cleavage/methylation domain-containing protein [Phycisphaerae bacterium]|nr:prepilin-type N-terminal cleavage/methylation domain-containing protein [Phycisphaerae bacterium]